jgi:SAM-dependent methyltransferase
MTLTVHKETSFGVEEGMLKCNSCGLVYPINNGVIDSSTDVAKRGEGVVKWDRNRFEEFYSKRGYYETAAEWVQPFVPPYIQDYRYPRITGRMLEWLKPKADYKILYVGCGVGWLFFEIMKTYPGINMTFFGLDVVHSNIGHLVYRRNKEHKQNIIGVVGDAQSLPFSAGEFDIVVSSEVLEHIYDKRLALKEIHRVLKKDGRFIFSTPSAEATVSWQWAFIVPRFLKSLFREPASPGQLVYDEPLPRRILWHYLKSAGFKPLNFEQNIFVPHECYFQYFPDFFNRLLVEFGLFAEKYLRCCLRNLGLHFVAQYRK